jgi:rhodanese-related sulfurtransferase
MGQLCKTNGRVVCGRLLGLLVGAVALGGLAGCQADVRESDIKFVDSSELRRLVVDERGARRGQLLLIDPRSEREFGEGHIAGATNLTLDRVTPESSSRNPRFGDYKHVIVYGNDPASAPARAMTKRILGLRFKNARMYGGGFSEWSRTYPELVEVSAPAQP